MKSQVHNEGKLAELKVSIEEDVVKDFEQMAKNIDRPVEELVVIALKRFRASHTDYLKNRVIQE